MNMQIKVETKIKIKYWREALSNCLFNEKGIHCVTNYLNVISKTLNIL